MWGVGLLTALLTAFYMTRMMWLTFFGAPRWDDDVHPHESPRTMTVPLLALAGVMGLQALVPLPGELAMALLLIGVVPMAANVVVVAMELGIAPEKGALAVLITTLAAPLLIPLYLGAMMQLTGL